MKVTHFVVSSGMMAFEMIFFKILSLMLLFEKCSVPMLQELCREENCSTASVSVISVYISESDSERLHYLYCDIKGKVCFLFPLGD